MTTGSIPSQRRPAGSGRRPFRESSWWAAACCRGIVGMTGIHHAWASRPITFNSASTTGPDPPWPHAAGAREVPGRAAARANSSKASCSALRRRHLVTFVIAHQRRAVQQAPGKPATRRPPRAGRTPPAMWFGWISGCSNAGRADAYAAQQKPRGRATGKAQRHCAGKSSSLPASPEAQEPGEKCNYGRAPQTPSRGTQTERHRRADGEDAQASQEPARDLAPQARRAPPVLLSVAAPLHPGDRAP